MTRPIRAAAALLLCVAAVGAEPGPGRIAAVRIYRGQALVTRVIEFQAQPGAQDLVVTNLPERILPGSLYATASAGIGIRAVRFRSEDVAEAPREDVRKLDEQLADKQDELAKIQAELTVLDQHARYLDKLENFVAPTASAEMTKGVLNPETLAKLSRDALEQRTQIAQKKLELSKQQRKAQAELQVLIKQRRDLTGSGAKAQREAVIFADAAKEGPARIDLSYLVGGVSWAPAYVARLNEGLTKMTLEYHAVVAQMSGEDWPDVPVVLSTSSASMAAAAPALAPLHIGLVPSARHAGAADAKEYAAQRRQLEEQRRNAPAANAPGPKGERGQAGPQGPGARADEPLEPDAAALPEGGEAQDDVAANVLAARLQQLELTASDDAVKGAQRLADASEGIAVDYPLPGKVSLRSRNEQQMFRITSIELQPSFYYTAVPLLSEYVYQAVEAKNTSAFALLPGPYSAYVEGAYAGRGTLPLIASGQGLTIGFGTESRLKIVRDLEEKKTEIRGGNKQLRYTYRFRLQNFMDKAAVVRVWDRLPQIGTDQVTVTFNEGQEKLSTDALYLAQDRPRGLLRWDISVPGGAAGAQARTFTYQFQLEFDKNFDVGSLPAGVEERVRRDLAAAQKARAR